MYFEWNPFVLALIVATFGLIVDNLLNIDGAILVVGLNVVVLVADSVLTVCSLAVVVVVGVNSGILLLTDCDTIGIGKTAFDVTFSL